MGQMNRRPSIWCSKYYFFFMISCKILCKKPFNSFYYFFYKITKIKLKSFEYSKSIKSLKNKTWNIRRLVGDSFVPLSQRPSILYCRLSDLARLPIRNRNSEHMLPISHFNSTNDYFPSMFYIMSFHQIGNKKFHILFLLSYHSHEKNAIHIKVL